MPAVPTGSSLSTSYLWELQNMLNKLWVSPLLVLAGKLGGGKETALYLLLHMWVLPDTAQCEPEAPPATHVQKDQSHSHQSFDIISLPLKITISIKSKNAVPTLGFLTDMKTVRRVSAAVPGVLPQCPSAEIPFVSSFRMDVWKIPISQFHSICIM